MSIISKHFGEDILKGFLCENYEGGEIEKPCDEQCAWCDMSQSERELINNHKKSGNGKE